MTIKTIIAAAVVVFSAGCSAPETPLALQGIDACKHAKLMLIEASEVCKEDCNSIFPRISGNAQNQVMVASHAVKAVCGDAADGDKNDTWACAEGH